jgi:hypothetical protein
VSAAISKNAPNTARQSIVFIDVSSGGLLCYVGAAFPDRSLAEMLAKEINCQCKGTIRFRLAVGLASEARESVIGAGVFMDRHERIGR